MLISLETWKSKRKGWCSRNSGLVMLTIFFQKNHNLAVLMYIVMQIATLIIQQKIE